VFKVEYIATGVPDAPLVRMISNEDELRKLSFVITELLSDVSDCVSIDEILGGGGVNNCKLIFIRSQVSTGITETRKSVFECRLDRCDWENVLGLVDGVMEYSGPCSQWLYDQGEIALLLSTNDNGAW
jgi:hypothetical protein